VPHTLYTCESLFGIVSLFTMISMNTNGMAVLEENIRCWTVRAIPAHVGSGEAVIRCRDNRTGQVTRPAYLYRIPSGWRGTQIDNLPVPEYVKAAGRRLMRKLP
jgi:hypothetical protein